MHVIVLIWACWESADSMILLRQYVILFSDSDVENHLYDDFAIKDLTLTCQVRQIIHN